MKKDIPKAITKSLQLSIQNIIKYGNQVLRGLLHNQQGCHNFYERWRIKYIIQYSIARAIARKYDTSMKQTFKKYGANLTYTYTNAKGLIKETHLAMYKSFKRNTDLFKDWIFKIKEPIIYTYKELNLIARKCYLCGSSQERKLFHRKKKSLIKQPHLHIVKEMVRINRRQICLCTTCFAKIENNELEYNKITKSRKLI